MIKIDAFTERLIYLSKYGEEQDAKDVPSIFALALPERFSTKEELLYSAFGESREDAEKAMKAFERSTDKTITRKEYVEIIPDSGI